MHVFKRSGVTNFIDSNNFIVGWSDTNTGCHNPDWYIIPRIPEGDESILEFCYATEQSGLCDLLIYYEFVDEEPIEFEEYEDVAEDEDYLGLDNNYAVVFKLRPTKDAVYKGYVNPSNYLYLALTNTHNGWYSCNFKFNKPVTIKEGVV